MLSIADATLGTLQLIVAGGFVIGFLVGMTGVGAGALTTPLLITGVGMSPIVAVGTDLLFASITKASAAFRHHRLFNIDYGVLGWLAAGSLPGAALTLAWLYLAKPEMHALAFVIRKGLAVALIASAIAMALYPLVMGQRLAVANGKTAAVGLRRWLTMLFGVVLGATVALTSVGAGSIGVTILTALYPAMLARRIVGTDVVHAVPLTFLSGLGHAGLGHIDVGVLALLLVGSIPGIALGARLTGHLPDWVLRIALSLVMLNAAWLLWMKT